MTNYLQDPAERLAYACDFTALLSDGEAVTAHSVTISDGMSKVSDSRDGAKVTALVEGGVDGTTYVLTWQVTTDENQKFERSDRIRVTQL